MYQEHITTEEVARISHASCDPPDAEVSRKICEGEFLKYQKFCLAEISYFVSGAHGYRRDGTNKQRSWYSGFSEKIPARISQNPEVLPRWNFVFCIRSTWLPKRWHDMSPLLVMQMFLGGLVSVVSWESVDVCHLQFEVPSDSQVFPLRYFS